MHTVPITKKRSQDLYNCRRSSKDPPNKRDRGSGTALTLTPSKRNRQGPHRRSDDYGEGGSLPIVARSTVKQCHHFVLEVSEDERWPVTKARPGTQTKGWNRKRGKDCLSIHNMILTQSLSAEQIADEAIKATQWVPSTGTYFAGVSKM
jgi:hypothetical protein